MLSYLKSKKLVEHFRSTSFFGGQGSGCKGFNRFNRFNGFSGEGSGFAANIYGQCPKAVFKGPLIPSDQSPVTSYQLLYDLRDAVLFIRSADVTGRFFRDPVRIGDGVGYACVA